jgi:Crinkler effector protein N-terminal domain
MVKLFCALVGENGNSFSIKIDVSESVDDLKVAIKQRKERTITCDADNLKLFLGKKSKVTWLDSSSEDVKRLKKGEKTPLIEALTLERKELQGEFGLEEVLEGMQVPQNKEIHVLVVVPKNSVRDITEVTTPFSIEQIKMVVKEALRDQAIEQFDGEPASKQATPHDLQVARKQIVQVDEWFVNESFSFEKKKRKLDQYQSDQFTSYFKMLDFPPLLSHPMSEFNCIMIRDAYVVIFENLMNKVNSRLKRKSDSNMVVTGNPGIGKSRFYLYCIFQLVCRDHEALRQFSPELVLNFESVYYKYNASTREFIKLEDNEVQLLRNQTNVLRLIEARSSQLMGWRGVSILFASPGLAGMRDYAKVNSYSYIMPAWSLEELLDYNQLLDDRIKLAEEVLISRYYNFGGIPRSIFTVTDFENNMELEAAIGTFNLFDILSYAKSGHLARGEMYSHRVLEMVPSREDFRAAYYLDFLSKDIAEKVVNQIKDDSLQRLSEFAIAQSNDDSGSSSALHGRIYETLCHRQLNL